MTRVNHYFTVDPAMSHNAVFYNISGEVIWFLTIHTSPWYMDAHSGASSSLNPCPCCLSREKNTNLSVLKTTASGRSVPRWRVIQRLRTLEMVKI